MALTQAASLRLLLGGSSHFRTSKDKDDCNPALNWITDNPNYNPNQMSLPVVFHYHPVMVQRQTATRIFGQSVVAAP
jgi:hypothetical protein